MDELVPEMSSRYGGSPPYTEAQVWITIDELRRNERYAEFAIAVLCKTDEENPFDSKELIKLRSYRRVGSGGGTCGGCCGGSSGVGEGSCGGGGGD